jgi:hypothetical protein
MLPGALGSTKSGPCITYPLESVILSYNYLVPICPPEFDLSGRIVTKSAEQDCECNLIKGVHLTQARCAAAGA